MSKNTITQKQSKHSWIADFQFSLGSSCHTFLQMHFTNLKLALKDYGFPSSPTSVCSTILVPSLKFLLTLGLLFRVWIQACKNVYGSALLKTQNEHE